MGRGKKWTLTEEEKLHFIDVLTPELVMLRNKARISQDELSNLLGVSRQTYGAIERGTRRMTWNTYLSIILFYDTNQSTHELIRSVGAFPMELVNRFNKGENQFEVNVEAFLTEGMTGVVDKLDEQAMRSIRTLIMLEYARCTGTPGEAILMSFDGVNFTAKPKAEDLTVTAAMKTVRRGRRRKSDAK